MSAPRTGGLRPFAPQRFGRFTLLAPLAAGGMGQIYLARARFAGGLEKLCVIKKILPEFAQDPGFAARFRDEARTLVQLQHGSIAQVYDSGEEAGAWWIALEFVDGKDLRRLLQRMRETGKRVPLEVALYVAIRILEALGYAHRKRDAAGAELGLVHRDVSPQNVLLSYEGEVKVIDFGLARSATTGPEAEPGVVMGKFHYMAPEQARNETLDRRADLYAVGVVLYELLANWNPLEDAPPAEVVAWAADPRIPPLRRVAPHVPECVAGVVAKALAPAPEGRFANAEEMRARLAACLSEVAPDAGPEGLAALLAEAFAEEFRRERQWMAALGTGAAFPQQDETAGGLRGGTLPFGASPRGDTLPFGAVAAETRAAPAVALHDQETAAVPWDRTQTGGAAALRSAAAAAESVPRGVPWYESSGRPAAGGAAETPAGAGGLPQSHAGASSQPQTHAQTGAKPQSHAGASSQPQTHAQAGAKPQSHAGASSQPQAHAGASSQPQPHAGATTQPQAGAQPQAHAPAQMTAGPSVQQQGPPAARPDEPAPGDEPAVVSIFPRRSKAVLALTCAALAAMAAAVLFAPGAPSVADDGPPPRLEAPVPVPAAPATAPAPTLDEPPVEPAPTPAPPPTVAAPTPRPAPADAPAPASATATAPAAVPAVARRAVPSPGERLQARHRAVLRKYEQLVEAHGAEQVGGILAGLVRATDSQFQRLVSDPTHHDDLQRQLDELDRLLEERRRAFAR